MSAYDAYCHVGSYAVTLKVLTVVIQVLASYINPGKQIPKDVGVQEAAAADDEDKDACDQNVLPTLLPELFSQSCLIPALSSYLRNDSGNVQHDKFFS
jgi:baculoviral IAP repeat-containing protein 6